MSTHLNKDGNAQMVDVSEKLHTKRVAKAKTTMQFNQESYNSLKEGYVKKGDILSIAQVAGIMACKNTSNIIPLCHPLPISHIDIEYGFNDEDSELQITSIVETTFNTGVEMEALTCATVTALTVYDMLKSVDKGIIIKETKLLMKSGGKSEYKG